MIVKPYFADFAGIEFGKKDDAVLRPCVKESTYGKFCFPLVLENVLLKYLLWGAPKTAHLQLCEAK